MSPYLHVDVGDIRGYVVPDGIVMIAMWDFDINYDSHARWAQTAELVDPKYANPPILPPRHWTKCAQLEAGPKRADSMDVHAEVRGIGFELGKGGFMQFF